MPRLWNDTIETHRQSVRDAVLDAAAALVTEEGPTSVTMARIARDAGIGRATLYKYFPDAEAILIAWHERMIARHLHQLHAARHQADNPLVALRHVLETYAHSIRTQHGQALAAQLHRLPHARSAQEHLRRFVEELVGEAARAGLVRSDVSAHELTAYALGALSAAESLPSHQAIVRLVDITLDGMARPPHESAQQLTRTSP